MTPLLQGGIVLWLWQVSQQTFWTLLDPASEVFSKGGEIHCRGAWGFCKGVLERVLNAGEMLQECQTGLF